VPVSSGECVGDQSQRRPQSARARPAGGGAGSGGGFVVNSFEHRHRAQQQLLEQQQQQLREQQRLIEEMQALQRQQLIQQRLAAAAPQPAVGASQQPQVPIDDHAITCTNAPNTDRSVEQTPRYLVVS